MLDKNDLSILEELINEEIHDYFNSGYNIDDEYIVRLRNILQKLNLEEYYDYDNWKHKN
jgi:hypothetical protein